MVKGIASVRQEIAAIEQQVKETAGQLQQVYLEYLDLFERSLERQLILACYHLCTQIYPQAFLKLSFSAKQQLQEQLKHIAKQFQPQLIEQFNLIDLMLLEQIQAVESQPIQSNQSLDLEIETSEPEPESDYLSTPVELATQISQYQHQAVSDLTNPLEVLQWQKQLETAIKKTLEFLSAQANDSFRKFNILSSKIPVQIIEIALKTEEAGSSASNIPHIMHLVVETSKPNGDEEKPATRPAKITILRLRSADLEFADPTLNAQRQPIQNLRQKISKIKQRYQQKQQELAVAEAEAAWRACWYED